MSDMSPEVLILWQDLKKVPQLLKMKAGIKDRLSILHDRLIATGYPGHNCSGIQTQNPVPLERRYNAILSEMQALEEDLEWVEAGLSRLKAIIDDVPDETARKMLELMFFKGWRLSDVAARYNLSDSGAKWVMQNAGLQKTVKHSRF